MRPRYSEESDILANEQLPTPSSTPYEPRTRIYHGSTPGSSSPPIPSPPTPNDDGIDGKRDLSPLDPRRFTPTLHASLISEILGLRREVDKKHDLIENLEDKLHDATVENEELVRQLAGSAAEARTLKRQLHHVETSTTADLRELERERAEAKETNVELKRRLEQSQKRLHLQEEAHEKAEMAWHRAQQTWGDERRSFERRIHVSEGRMRAVIAELALDSNTRDGCNNDNKENDVSVEVEDDHGSPSSPSSPPSKTHRREISTGTFRTRSSMKFSSLDAHPIGNVLSLAEELRFDDDAFAEDDDQAVSQGGTPSRRARQHFPVFPPGDSPGSRVLGEPFTESAGFRSPDHARSPRASVRRSRPLSRQQTIEKLSQFIFPDREYVDNATQCSLMLASQKPDRSAESDDSVKPTQRASSLREDTPKGSATCDTCGRGKQREITPQPSMEMKSPTVRAPEEVSSPTEATFVEASEYLRPLTPIISLGEMISSATQTNPVTIVAGEHSMASSPMLYTAGGRVLPQHYESPNSPASAAASSVYASDKLSPQNWPDFQCHLPALSPGSPLHSAVSLGGLKRQDGLGNLRENSVSTHDFAAAADSLQTPRSPSLPNQDPSGVLGGDKSDTRAFKSARSVSPHDSDASQAVTWSTQVADNSQVQPTDGPVSMWASKDLSRGPTTLMSMEMRSASTQTDSLNDARYDQEPHTPVVPSITVHPPSTGPSTPKRDASKKRSKITRGADTFGTVGHTPLARGEQRDANHERVTFGISGSAIPSISTADSVKPASRGNLAVAEKVLVRKGSHRKLRHYDTPYVLTQSPKALDDTPVEYHAGKNDDGPVVRDGISAPKRPVRSSSLYKGSEKNLSDEDLEDISEDETRPSFAAAKRIRMLKQAAMSNTLLFPAPVPEERELSEDSYRAEDLSVFDVDKSIDRAVPDGRMPGVDGTFRILKSFRSGSLRKQSSFRKQALVSSGANTHTSMHSPSPSMFSTGGSTASGSSKPTAPPLPIPIRMSSAKKGFARTEALYPTALRAAGGSPKRRHSKGRSVKKSRSVRKGASPRKLPQRQRTPSPQQPRNAILTPETPRSPRAPKLLHTWPNGIHPPPVSHPIPNNGHRAQKFSITSASGKPVTPDEDQGSTVIDAIAATMVGEWMWKYMRRRKNFSVPDQEIVDPGSGGGQRHKRWVWLSPYERCIMWSSKQPTSEGALMGKSGRKLAVQSVLDVHDDNPLPKESTSKRRGPHSTPSPVEPHFNRSILILTPSRAIKFTALTKERHYIWLTALSFLAHSYRGNGSLPLLPTRELHPQQGSLRIGSRPVDAGVIPEQDVASDGELSFRGGHSLPRRSSKRKFSNPFLPWGTNSISTRTTKGPHAVAAPITTVQTIRSSSQFSDVAEGPVIPRYASLKGHFATSSSGHTSHDPKRSNTGPRIPPATGLSSRSDRNNYANVWGRDAELRPPSPAFLMEHGSRERKDSIMSFMTSNTTEAGMTAWAAFDRTGSVKSSPAKFSQSSPPPIRMVRNAHSSIPVRKPPTYGPSSPMSQMTDDDDLVLDASEYPFLNNLSVSNFTDVHHVTGKVESPRASGEREQQFHHTGGFGAGDSLASGSHSRSTSNSAAGTFRMEAFVRPQPSASPVPPPPPPPSESGTPTGWRVSSATSNTSIKRELMPPPLKVNNSTGSTKVSSDDEHVVESSTASSFKSASEHHDVRRRQESGGGGESPSFATATAASVERDDSFSSQERDGPRGINRNRYSGGVYDIDVTREKRNGKN